jgi:hypothetical protein
LASFVDDLAIGGNVHTIGMDSGPSHIAGVEGIGHADQTLARCHLTFACHCDPQPQRSAVNPHSVQRDEAAQDHVKQPAVNRHQQSLSPQQVRWFDAGLVIVDLEGDRVIAIGHWSFCHGVSKQALVVDQERGTAPLGGFGLVQAGLNQAKAE